MSDAPQALHGPDLSSGVAVADIPDGGILAGHARGKPVLLYRQGDDVSAVGAQCTHYGGPLGEGLVVDGTVRCPWHHACFDLRTGEAVRAPALNPVARWDVERRDDGGTPRVVVTRELDAPDGATPRRAPASAATTPRSVVIVGSGAAGNAAAEMLRREGYDGPITMLGADPSEPVDRPNLSKDYLAGNAPEEWIPLRGDDFYVRHRIELRRGRVATSVDAPAHEVVLDGGERVSFDRLLLATGADPVRLDIPGADLPHVHYLRTLAQSRAIIAAAEQTKRAVVMGASFIGLEVAASLRARGLDVHVVAPDEQPLARVLGPAFGAWVRDTHEKHGVVFHLGRTAVRVDAHRVTLDDGSTLDADVVVVGVGVRPALALAESAGAALAHDKRGGVRVNEYLETSVPGVYAAGDIARYPDPRTGDAIRVEHWVVAERQGQAAARNIVGRAQKYADVPFFWSAHYDAAIAYVGHAERWDDASVYGDLAKNDAAVAYRANGKVLAVATLGRDRLALEVEAAMERGDDAAIERALSS